MLATLQLLVRAVGTWDGRSRRLGRGVPLVPGDQARFLLDLLAHTGAGLLEDLPQLRQMPTHSRRCSSANLRSSGIPISSALNRHRSARSVVVALPLAECPEACGDLSDQVRVVLTGWRFCR